MSQNVELAREVFDAVTRQDLARLIELTDPDVAWESFFSLGEEGGAYRGHSGIERYIRELRDAWEVVEPTIEDAIGVGAVVFVVGRLDYRGRGSGVASQSTAGWVLKFRGGKVELFRALKNPEKALEAAELSE